MLLPIGHDSLSSRRLPIVTIVIVALNVLVFVATLVVGPRQRDARARAARGLRLVAASQATGDPGWHGGCKHGGRRPPCSHR